MTSLLLGLLLFLYAAFLTSFSWFLAVPTLRGLGLERRNFAGEPVLSGAGLVPAVAIAIVALAVAWVTALTSPFKSPTDAVTIRPVSGITLALAALLFALLGFLDDLWGSRGVGGLRGHFRCLIREGRVTTGLVKAVGGAITGLAVGGIVTAQSFSLSPPARIGATVLIGAWVALAANAVNLLDLRPLRAIKGAAFLAALVGILSAGSRDGTRLPSLVYLPVVAGALATYLPREARREVMLGDAGANALGAAVAVIGVWTLPLWAIGVLTVVLVVFHAWTERHSLSEAIAARPWLARLDAWGWRQD